MRILIVDDEYVSRSQLKALLSEYGDCDAAANGELALQMVHAAWEEGFPYTLLTIDIEMPGLSGQETLKKLRDWEQAEKIYQQKKEAVVLMVSVKDSGSAIMSSFSSGCEGYLVKPAGKDELHSALQKAGVIH